jgi:hypothetical protein
MKKGVLILLSASFLMASTSGFLKFFEKRIAKKSGSVIEKSTKRVDDSYYTKKLLKENNIKVYKPIDKLATTATLIAKRGGIAEEITKRYPLKMVNYYSKYGDDFIKVTNTMLPKIENIKIPNNLITKYHLNNLYFLSNKNAIAQRFLDVIKWTGKKGFEISKSLLKLANKHKFYAVSGIAFAWFLANPQSFDEALKKSGKKIEDFVLEIEQNGLNTAKNIVNHSVDTVTSTLTDIATQKNILFVFGILVLIILFKVRKIISKYFQLKILKKEKKLDDELEKTRNRSRYE